MPSASPSVLRSALAVLALVALAACSAPPPDAPAADGSAGGPAARGAPLGAPTTRVIGPGGGTLASPDGRLRVEVPPGALREPTPVAIQPVTGVAPHAVGAGYRLSPEGVRFTRPVRLVFAHTAEDAANRSPAGFGIAFQDAGGRWLVPRAPATDADTRRVAVTTDHFSDWALVETFRLVPASATVKTGGRLALEVQQCVQEEDSGVTVHGIALTPLVPTCTRLADGSRVRAWAVNGVAGGSPATGTVAPQGAGAIYAAPAVPPPTDPVAVSAEVALPGRGKLLLVANLRVVADCPAPVCHFTGTARVEDLVGDELLVTGEATVTWRFSHMDGTEAVYLPGGTVAAEWKHPDCPITLSAPTHVVRATRAAGPGPRSELRVDFTRTPATYRGSGSSEWEGEQTWRCPNGGSHVQEGIGATWFSGEGVAEANGRVLRGSSRTETANGRWEFHAP